MSQTEIPEPPKKPGKANMKASSPLERSVKRPKVIVDRIMRRVLRKRRSGKMIAFMVYRMLQSMGKQADRPCSARTRIPKSNGTRSASPTNASCSNSKGASARRTTRAGSASWSARKCVSPRSKCSPTSSI